MRRGDKITQRWAFAERKAAEQAKLTAERAEERKAAEQVHWAEGNPADLDESPFYFDSGPWPFDGA